MSKDYPWGKGTPSWLYDATANDSSKDFTVPTGKIWNLKGVFVTLAATATVGNRVLRIRIFNGATQYFQSPASPNLAASSTEVVMWATYGQAASGAATNNVMCLPDIIIPAGYVVRVLDAAAIDAAADDMTVVLHYVEYDA